MWRPAALSSRDSATGRRVVSGMRVTLICAFAAAVVVLMAHKQQGNDDGLSAGTMEAGPSLRFKRFMMMEKGPKDDDWAELHAAGAASKPTGAATAASSGAGPPYEMVVGMSHHKSGTYQLRCLMHHFSKTADLEDATGPCFKDHSVGPDHLASCLHARKAAGANLPALFTTFHGVSRTCETQQQDATNPCLSFMIYRNCSKGSVAAMRRPARQCSLDLPHDSSSKLGFFNIVRNPIDAVLSAYSFHTSRPPSEPWLFKPQAASWLAQKLQWAGASDSELEAFGLDKATSRRDITYVDVLGALPTEKGVLMEFFHSLPEITSMAGQYSLLKGHRGAFQARFEALRDDYNATLLAALEHLQLGPHPKKLLKATLRGGCDPGVWTAEQRAASDHVTTGKKTGVKEAAEAALMGYAPAREILCKLCEELDYTDARCGGRSVNKWRRSAAL